MEAIEHHATEHAIQVFGESNDTRLCVIEMDPADRVLGIDVAQLKWLICSHPEVDGLGLTKDNILLHLPGRAIPLDDSVYVRGGQTVHVHSAKGQQQQQKEAGNGTVVFVGASDLVNGLYLVVPPKENLLHWMCVHMNVKAADNRIVDIQGHKVLVSRTVAEAMAAAAETKIAVKNDNNADKLVKKDELIVPPPAKNPASLADRDAIAKSFSAKWGRAPQMAEFLLPDGTTLDFALIQETGEHAASVLNTLATRFDFDAAQHDIYYRFGPASQLTAMYVLPGVRYEIRPKARQKST
jgi:hypothetical protein